ncbi:hypothetical protein GBA65_15430 [Rubrobacter marinus]|uniref:Uncharacterized protein n=1 Tax=Rubrobacter marinus TaxID=2653852 RepID=A0A6G8PZP9_9ACTN|nr:hypothetical protein [Rubrobacter marinus]QIN79691.1 hypothetical protein GBA65_15430 [Rubrobacter marinus]
MERDPGGAYGQTGSTGGATGQAKQQGQQIAAQARQQASKLASQGGEQVKGQLANQKHNAAQRIAPVQTALRETAHQLRNQGQAPSAEYVDRATDQVERFSDYLRETDVDEMIGEVRGFARRRPGLFLGGAATLGFLASRFLKSSSQEQLSHPGGRYETTGTALNGSEVRYGAGQPTALPPGAVEGEHPADALPFSERERMDSSGGAPIPPREY